MLLKCGQRLAGCLALTHCNRGTSAPTPYTFFPLEGLLFCKIMQKEREREREKRRRKKERKEGREEGRNGGRKEERALKGTTGLGPDHWKPRAHGDQGPKETKVNRLQSLPTCSFITAHPLRPRSLEARGLIFSLCRSWEIFSSSAGQRYQN